MSEYKYNNKTYTEQEVSQAADSVGMDFNKYVKSYGIELLKEDSSQEPENVSWFDQTWFGRGIAAASTTGEATDLMSQNFSNIDMESIQEFMKAKEGEAKSHVPSDRMSKFQEQYVKEGKTWAAFFRGVKNQPGLLPELFVQSLGTQVGTAIDSPGVSLGFAAAGAGTGAAVAGPLGALTGLMGGLATSMEAALTFGELIETRLKEKNQEFTDENIKALLEAEGTEIRNKSIGRGLTIGAIEGFSGGLAGKASVAASKVAKGAKRATVAAGAAGVGVEAVGGATGEVLGRVVAGQEMDAAEIGFEAITGTVTAPLNVSAALLTAKKPTYKLNGASVTYEQMKSFVDTADDIDIAKADIKMENDFTGIGKKAQAKQEAAEKMLELADDTETTLEVLSEKSANIAERKYQDNMVFAKKHSGLYGLKFTELTEEEIQQKYDTEEEKFSDSLGFIQGDEIVINKDKAKTKVYGDNVGNHELLHGIIKASGAQIEQSTIDNFFEIIGEDNTNVIKERIRKNYKQSDVDADRSEYFTIFSDALRNEEIKFNDSVFTKVKDFMRRVFATIGFSDVDFNDAQSAYNFLKDYNKSIHKGSLSLGVQVATGGTAVFENAVFSKEASDKVQSIYEEKGATGAFDIIEQFKPIVSRIADKRREAPNFDKELLMSEIEIGPRGILDLIRDYKPDSGVPLAAYINKFLPARAIEASRRVLGEEFTQDVTEAKGVVAEETAEVEVKAKPRKKKIILADRLGITEKVSKAIDKIVPDLNVDKLTFKTLKNKIPSVTGELFGIAPKKIESLANLTKKELQSAQMFINKNADLLVAMLPEGATVSGTATGIPNTLLKAFYTKTSRAKSAKTGSKAGLAIQQKKAINKKQFLETFGIIDGKPDRTDRNTSARVLALANLTGKMVTNQTVRQKLGEVDAKAKENVDRIKDGKSSVMFSRSAEDLANPLDNFQLMYEHKLGVLSKALYGRNVEIPLTDLQSYDSKTGKVRKGKTFRSRNLNAIFDKETEETYRQAAIRVVNTFLESHPQYRSLIRSTMTGGKKGGLFKFGNSSGKKFLSYKKATGEDINFDDNIVDYPGVEQVGKKQAYNKSEKYSPDFHKEINTEEFKKENTKKLKELLGFFEAIEAHLQNFKSDIWLFEEMMKDTSKHMNTVTRILAPIKFYPVDVETKQPIFNKKAVEEHTDPQNLIGKALLSGAFFNKLNDVWSVVGKSYMQGSILKVDDPGGNLKANMPASYYEGVVPRLISGDLKLPNGYSSIIRLAEAGVDPKAYMLIDENMTIAEFFKVDKIKDVKKANELIIKQLTGEIKPEYAENIAKVTYTKDVKSSTSFSKSVESARVVKDPKGITVLDFDDTLATTKSLVKFTTPEGETGTLNAEEYASTYEDLLDKGYAFDFSDFNKVVKGKLAPLFNKAIKLQGKFGPSNMFVLTARPPQAQKAIFDFLKANGLNIPLENITGLGNSTAEAKALWIADKVGEGFNDFYFADDALQNVQAVKNMLDQFDVKSKVQQAKTSFSRSMDDKFNDILEDVTGIESKKRFDFIKARKRGASKGKFRFFIPPSHEDFVGLLYNFMGKGLKGNKHRDFLEQSLVRPLNRANKEYDTARQSVATDYKNLNKQMPDVKKKLLKKTPDGDFIYQDAIRVYLWDKHGYDIPGLSPIDQKNLVELVKSDGKLQSYADTINTISKQETYVNPTDGWDSGDIRMDLDDATGRIGRAQFFEEFNENADIIFSKENLNKIEAGYGKNVREALEDILYRIKTGRNKPTGQNRMVNSLMNWVNGSVGSVMFFNMRSALLQQMSLVNYINFADNNIFAAAKAFANQKQYWNDWSFIFNSDMLKQRRGGIMTDVNGAELAAEMRKSKNPHRFLISKLLELGFLPTQIGDNIAIATGGATYYRNRINTYLKQGLSQKEAEAKAFTDFQDITQSTQQSARPDMVSQQQASLIGKIILNFQNVTSQFNRLGKKAFLDIKNRRITKPNSTQMQSDISNAARITYYFAVQNAIFYTLQTALFAMMFDDDEEDVNNLFLKKKERLINGSIDSVLRGTGIGGAIISTLKNTAIAFARQRDVNYNPDESAVIVEAFNFSPVLGIKARKIVNAEKTLNYNKKVIKEMETFDIDNPQWSAVTNYVEGFTNAPLNRLYNKTQNVRQGLSNEHAAWERTLLFLGWSQYNLNLENEKMDKIKESTKKTNKKGSQTQPAWLLKNKSSSKSSSKNKKAKKPVGFLP